MFDPVVDSAFRQVFSDEIFLHRMKNWKCEDCNHTGYGIEVHCDWIDQGGCAKARLVCLCKDCQQRRVGNQ